MTEEQNLSLVRGIRSLLQKVTPWGAIGVSVMILGAVAGVQRFTEGLGATTNLSDRFPWGFWIGFDFLGIGMAAAGFTIVATVHLLHIERFEPIVRPAILTALIGYTLVVLILVVDLGRWDRFWHPLVMWNPHSVMFEITWCVILYSTVLMLEFAPIVFEKFGKHRWTRILRTISLPVMIAGVILSTLHQSSFGSLYLAVPGRLHPLWYSPLLPVLFFISCLAAGLAMVIFETHLLARVAGFRLPDDIRSDLGKVIAVILAIYGTVRVQDLIVRKALDSAFTFDYHAIFFWMEFLLGTAVPVFLLLSSRLRSSPRGIFIVSVMVLSGFAANRMNTVVTGLESWPSITYLPSPQEAFIGLGIAAFGFMAFYVIARILPILPQGARRPRSIVESLPEAQKLRVVRGIVSVGVALAIFATGLTAIAFNGNGRHASPKLLPQATLTFDMKAALEHFKVPADITIPPVSAESPGPVVFRHTSHVDPSAPDCVGCHSGKFRLLGPPEKPLERGAVNWHEAKRCGSCHNGELATNWEEDCTRCHVSQ